jgi:uncharacterized protein (TIGR02246 family)
MLGIARVVTICASLVMPSVALAGPAEDANAAVERWSAAYSSNDTDAVVQCYWPDAVLLGTVSPLMSEGAEAIRTYFSRVRGSGNKNALGDHRTFVLDDNAVIVAGFYTFTRMQEGKPVPGPSRFTMLITNRGGEWKIADQHSSPHVQPKQ